MNNQAETNWTETTEAIYTEMLEVLWPAKWDMDNHAFAVGEPLTHDDFGPVHQTFVFVDGRYFYRDAHLLRFDAMRYKREIRAQFANSD